MGAKRASRKVRQNSVNNVVDFDIYKKKNQQLKLSNLIFILIIGMIG